MTAIAISTVNYGVVYPQRAEIYDVVVTEAVTALQAAYQLTTGKFGLADANAAGKQQFRGIYLGPAAANRAASLLVRGHIFGFTVAALNADVPLFLSDTVGALDDAAGTLSVNCGRVVALPDFPTLTKVVYIDADWLRTWA